MKPEEKLYLVLPISILSWYNRGNLIVGTIIDLVSCTSQLQDRSGCETALTCPLGRAYN